MNSLSILSSRVSKVIGSSSSSSTPPATPKASDPLHPAEEEDGRCIEDDSESDDDNEATTATATTTKPRIIHHHLHHLHHPPRRRPVGERLYLALLSPWFGAVRWIMSTIAASANWLVACVYNDEGAFSPLMPVRWTAQMVGRPFGKGKRRGGGVPQISLQDFDSDTAPDPTPSLAPQLHHHARSFGSGGSGGTEAKASAVEEILPRRSIRIRLYNEETLQKNKASSVKSPTSPSPSLRLTKYPRAAGPPVPLLSRKPSPKTLILDLDETLIHSLAKGGRMSSGHMVEVKLDRQHAMLYCVHKRPYCDEFLRKVAKWYNLVVFTASVQEYADPVIDWLEQDRKYFKGRYYRQHCTNRNGAYIKDLSTVEPDLSKVMIIDNSPTSYILHEDNAIPIEGWINDPTDIDLLHLIPLLQALQYVADVRALLALRMGEAPS